jgi:hypothetical protein
MSPFEAFEADAAFLIWSCFVFIGSRWRLLPSCTLLPAKKAEQPVEKGHGGHPSLSSHHQGNGATTAGFFIHAAFIRDADGLTR